MIEVFPDEVMCSWNRIATTFSVTFKQSVYEKVLAINGDQV